VSLLEVEGLCKTWGDRRAVDGLSLAVEEGQIYGLLGPNGAGKTTTISMISGAISPGGGTARVAGHDIVRDAMAARRALGIVPQDLALYEEITARQNLRFFASLYGLRGAERTERMDWALGVAGLTDRADEPVSKFSGGMKRRLNLAAGLLHKPRLLILDEPTVGVDPQSRKHIFDSIRALRDDGMTILYTSHYMEEAQALCDRVAIMDHGKLLADDTVDGLVASHGGGSLELELDGNIGAALAAVAGLGEATAEGKTLRVLPSGDLGPIVSAVEGSGATITSLRTLSADLETVFLLMTGHTLRDD